MLPNRLLQRTFSWNCEKWWLTTTTNGEPYIATEATSPMLPTNSFRWWWSWKEKTEMIEVVQKITITSVTIIATFICTLMRFIHQYCPHVIVHACLLYLNVATEKIHILKIKIKISILEHIKKALGPCIHSEHNYISRACMVNYNRSCIQVKICY